MKRTALPLLGLLLFTIALPAQTLPTHPNGTLGALRAKHVPPLAQPLLTHATREPLGAVREKLWAHFQDLAGGQEAAVIPIFHAATNALVNPRLGGMPIDNQGVTQFKLITLGS